MISEPLNVAGHQNYPEGTEHGYAATIGGDTGSFHHNLIAHAEGRSWSMGGGLDPAGYFAGRLDIRNNVVYNFGEACRYFLQKAESANAPERRTSDGRRCPRGQLCGQLLQAGAFQRADLCPPSHGQSSPLRAHCNPTDLPSMRTACPGRSSTTVQGTRCLGISTKTRCSSLQGMEHQ